RWVTGALRDAPQAFIVVHVQLAPVGAHLVRLRHDPSRIRGVTARPTSPPHAAEDRLRSGCGTRARRPNVLRIEAHYGWLTRHGSECDTDGPHERRAEVVREPPRAAGHRLRGRPG